MEGLRDGECTISNTAKLDYFDCDAIQQLVKYRWESGANELNKLQFVVQLVFWAFMIDYICWFYYGPAVFTGLYPEDSVEHFDQYFAGLIVLMVMETVSECTQAANFGFWVYFTERSNVQDMSKILFGYLHIIYSKVDSPYSILSKYFLVAKILSSTYQFFEILRVFESFSSVVAMVRRSLLDLRNFLAMMVLCSYVFSLCFAVLQFCNLRHEGPYQDRFGAMEFNDQLKASMPMLEYHQLNRAWGYFLHVIRIAIGDFSLDGIRYMERVEQWMLLLIFLFCLLLFCIIFLNFVVAKAMESHSEFTLQKVQVLTSEKSQLIDDTDLMTPNRFKTKDKFPRYIINRFIEA